VWRDRESAVIVPSAIAHRDQRRSSTRGRRRRRNAACELDVHELAVLAAHVLGHDFVNSDRDVGCERERSEQEHERPRELRTTPKPRHQSHDGQQLTDAHSEVKNK
jgi:hypothetical protein